MDRSARIFGPRSAFLLFSRNVFEGCYVLRMIAQSGVDLEYKRCNMRRSFKKAGPLLLGAGDRFTFDAVSGDPLFFAIMFVESYDLVPAPMETGIPLFNEDMTISGEVTERLTLWDAGTEMNAMPGFGAHQPIRQCGPNSGPDEMMPVAEVEDVYYYPMVADLIRVTITAK